MPTLQYRERSAAVAHSTNQPSEFRRNVECATAALRSRYCTDRSTLTKIRVFVQSPVRAGVDQVKRYVLLVLLTTLSDHFILNLPTELSAMLPKYRKPFLSTAFAISA